MLYTIERRKLNDSGSLVTRYDVVKWSGIGKLGLYAAETIRRFNTKREAEKYCTRQKISIYIEQ